MGIFSRFAKWVRKETKQFTKWVSGNVKVITSGESEHKLLNWIGAHHIAIGVR